MSVAIKPSVLLIFIVLSGIQTNSFPNVICCLGLQCSWTSPCRVWLGRINRCIIISDIKSSNHNCSLKLQCGESAYLNVSSDCGALFYLFYQGIWFADLLGLQAGVPVIPAGLAAAPQPSLPPVAPQGQEPAQLPLNPLFQGQGGQNPSMCFRGLKHTNTHTHSWMMAPFLMTAASSE